MPTQALGGPVIFALASLVDAQATAQLIRQIGKGKHTGAPRIKPGAIGAAAGEIQRLRNLGYDPVVQTDLETGNLIVGTRDQDLSLLAAERNLRLRTTPSVQDLREAGFYEAVERARRTPTTPAPGTVMAPASSAAHDVVARSVPGAVVRGRLGMSARGGPCAGLTSAFQRISCNLGDLS
jgi:hypothetical protein